MEPNAEPRISLTPRTRYEILRTTDAGVNWSAQLSGANNDLLDVHFLDTSTGWVVGGEGSILQTLSGGN